jgi:hypothetical protein
MNTQIDTEEIETTRSEKLLAFVLAIFLLIGGVWIYFKLDDIPAKPDHSTYPDANARRADVAAIDRQSRLADAALAAQRRERQARSRLEIRREAYRTALDAGGAPPALEQSYNRAQASYEHAQRATRAATAVRNAQRPQADAAQRRIDGLVARTQRKRADQQDKHDREAFGLRLVYVLGCIGLAYWLLDRVRRRRPRYLAAALAFVGFAAAQALVMGGDYLYDYVEFTEAGPLTISLVGVALTFTAFVGLQRYLARRIPMRRVRKRECPFCAFPVADNDRCEGCGRSVFARCSNCDNRRRVGTAHCGACGAA